MAGVLPQFHPSPGVVVNAAACHAWVRGFPLSLSSLSCVRFIRALVLWLALPLVMPGFGVSRSYLVTSVLSGSRKPKCFFSRSRQCLEMM